jgi:hypothetical protein
MGLNGVHILVAGDPASGARVPRPPRRARPGFIASRVLSSLLDGGRARILSLPLPCSVRLGGTTHSSSTAGIAGLCCIAVELIPASHVMMANILIYMDRNRRQRTLTELENAWKYY